jgi:Icc protein
VIMIAHVSDTHFDGTQRTAGRARAVMDYLGGLTAELDVVLVTGDIADHGQEAEYEQARQILVSRSPVLMCPGNHDSRAAFRRVLLGQPGSDEPVNQIRRTFAADFILCDSSIPGRPEGCLAEPTLAWLEATLEQTAHDRPVFIAFHHPPTVLNIPFIDVIRQTGGDRLGKIVQRHPNIAALLAGHAHTPAATTFAGRPLLIAPGVASTLKYSWEGGTADDMLNYQLPPALALHMLSDTGQLTTHYRTIT